jgi:histone-lysine N-methyltransferase SETD2
LKLVSEKAFIRPEAAKRIDPQTIKPENLTLPPDWAFERTAEGRPYYYHVAIRQTQWTVPTAADVALMNRQLAEQIARQKAAAANVEDIVAKTKAEAEEIRKANEAQRASEEAEKARLTSLHSDRQDKLRPARSSSSHHHHRKKNSKELAAGGSAKASSSDLKNEINSPSKDKKMLRLFSNVVVHTMSRYKDSLDHEQFKRRAKEVRPATSLYLFLFLTLLNAETLNSSIYFLLFKIV